MTEVYRKHGRVVRFEHGHVVRTTECGEAINDGIVFRAAPLDARVELPEIDEASVVATAREIAAIVHPPLSIERLIVTEGTAEHECDGIRWSERSARVHVAITHRHLRVLIDDKRDVAPIAEAFVHVGAEREAPRRVRLAPNVSAALLPSLVGTIELWQTAAPHDGKGQPILEQRITGTDFPNWYRPSYRTRPVRMPFHLKAQPRGTIDRSLPRAVALLAPVAGNVLHVLCVDGENVFPTTLAVERVLAAGDETHWYPYAAGSFGAELMV
jgi:hypothetical protein